MWRAKLRPAVYADVDLRTGFPIFEARWMAMSGTEVLFTTRETSALVFDFYWDPRKGGFLSIGERKWVHFDMRPDDRLGARIVPTVEEATSLLVLIDETPEVPFSLQIYVASRIPSGRVVGIDIPGMLEPPGFLFLGNKNPYAYADVVLPPLGLRRSYAGLDYSGLSFDGLSLIDADLTGVVMRGCAFRAAHLSSCSLARADLRRSEFPDASTVNCRFDGADLSGALLANTPHPGASFVRTILEDADLRGASLAGCDLTGARLARAKVEGADLRGACLDGVDLANVDLRGALLDGRTSLKGARFTHADLTGVSLAGLDLSDAVFTEAVMDGTDLRGALMEGTDFSYVDLRRTIFDPRPRFSVDPLRRTRFQGATVPYAVLERKWTALDLFGATIDGLPRELSSHDAPLQAEKAILCRLELADRVLVAARLQDADLRGANLTRSVLDYADMTGARLGDPTAPAAATLSGASLFNTSMRLAVLTGADFSNAAFWGEGATVEEATMPLVRFNGAFLAGMSFRNAPNLQGASFAGACLVNCQMARCNLTPYEGAPVSFVKACLQGVDFTDASLNGAVMLDAAVALEAGSLKVTIPVAGECIELDWDYSPTLLPERATSSDTRCPSGDSGPCTGPKLIGKAAPVRRWVSPACAEAAGAVTPLPPPPSTPGTARGPRRP